MWGGGAHSAKLPSSPPTLTPPPYPPLSPSSPPSPPPHPSFGGRAYTSVVINIACEPQHLDESCCSLEFGKRLAGVRNRAMVVVGTDQGDERAGLEAAARGLRMELRGLEAGGHGGGMVKGAPKSEVKSYQDNLEKKAALETQIKDATAMLSEAKGRAAAGAGAEDGGGGGVTSLAERVARLTKAHAVLVSIVQVGGWGRRDGMHSHARGIGCIRSTRESRPRTECSHTREESDAFAARDTPHL